MYILSETLSFITLNSENLEGTKIFSSNDWPNYKYVQSAIAQQIIATATN